MPHRTASNVPRPLGNLIEIAVTALLMVMGLRVFALEVYRIPTPSMMPTLMGTKLMDAGDQSYTGRINDRVLVDKVSYLLRDPARWEVVVFRYPLATVGQPNYVKRLVGLPKEELLLQHGDVWARPLGSNEDFSILRKPPRVQEQLWKRCYPRPGDERRYWTGWTVTGRHQKHDDGRLDLLGPSRVDLNESFHDDYRDGYPDELRARIPIQGSGTQWVNVVSDLRLQATLTPRAGAGPLRLQAAFGAFAVELLLDPRAGTARLDYPGAKTRTAAFAFAPETPISAELAFWDHQLGWLLAGGGARAESLEELELAPAPAARNDFTWVAEQGGWTIDFPALWRDIHYLPQLRDAGVALYEVPDGHYFLLGDNTQSSHDGRDWEARLLTVEPPVAGRRTLRGDSFYSHETPEATNPRLTASGDHLILRDEYGELYALPRRSITEDLVVPAPTVPREYLLGRVVAILFPWWPVQRARWLR